MEALIQEHLVYRNLTGHYRRLETQRHTFQLWVYDLPGDAIGAPEESHVLAVVNDVAYPLSRDGYLSPFYVMEKFSLAYVISEDIERVTRELAGMIGREAAL